MIRYQVALWLVITFLIAAFTGTADARRTGRPRTQAIDLIVLHSTGGPTCDKKTGKPIWVGGGTLQENMLVIEAHPQLGIHYMIDRDGQLRASVPEAQVAHHVFGYSERSIAIELINDGDGIDPFSQAQLTVLVDLLQDLRKRYGIVRSGIKRHSDLDLAKSPCDPLKGRKVDPGDAFPFKAIVDRVFE